MKKKRIIISIVIIIVSAISILLYQYINKYKDYKEIKLKNVGAIKVPKEWKCFKTEKGSNVYLIQYELISNDALSERSNDEDEGDDNGYYFENYDLGDDYNTTFLVANKSVDKETMEKISKSFDMTKWSVDTCLSNGGWEWKN